MIFRWTHSLNKIFLTSQIEEIEEYTHASALQGEVFSLQLAYRTDFLLNPLSVKVISPLQDFIQVRQVYSMPAVYFGEEQDDYILDNKPGLYPDRLGSCDFYRSGHMCTHSLWLSVKLPPEVKAGKYPIQLEISHFNAYNKARNFTEVTPAFELEVLPVKLPQAEFKVTQWLHCDCLASYYKVEPWSEEFFRILKNYLLNMRQHGLNVVYVPMFTPPLDTHVGMERPTMQSVEVFEDNDGNWSFDFSKLVRFINLALECGMDYLEFSHLMTQWGAEFTPKIMVRTADGKTVRRFGWDVRSNSELYQRFLTAFTRELNALLEKYQWNKIAYFHISDEPYEEHIESYCRASELFHRNLPGCKFIDALSRPEFYTRGLVDIPIPANNHIGEFTELDLPERWTYYCVSQWDQVPNQFAHLPSARNRIMGVLSYVYNLDGFLHWGYNFWFSQLSVFEVDPYSETCAGGGFPPGDAFKVYPGKDGIPEDSIRHEVFYESLQDLAALQLLEKQINRDKVLEFIQSQWNGKTMSMSDYPRESAWLLSFRQKLNQLLAQQ